MRFLSMIFLRMTAIAMIFGVVGTSAAAQSALSGRDGQLVAAYQFAIQELYDAKAVCLTSGGTFRLLSDQPTVAGPGVLEGVVAELQSRRLIVYSATNCTFRGEVLTTNSGGRSASLLSVDLNEPSATGDILVEADFWGGFGVCSGHTFVLIAVATLTQWIKAPSSGR